MFQCTLVPAPRSTLKGGAVELAVEVGAGCSGADLEDAVSRRYGTAGLWTDGIPVRSLRVGEPPLRNGAVLVDGSAPVPPAEPGASGPWPLALAVHGGPGAGTVVPLRRGRFGIGRSGTEIVLPDAELSREHARLDVSDTAVTLIDLHSANGTTVDGERVREAVVTTGSVIRCGNSTMSLVFGGGPTGSRVPEAAGTCVADPLPVGSPGLPGRRGRAAVLLTAALPLAIGAGLAAVTGMWMFLAFSVVSAASLLMPAAFGRRQRRALSAALAAAVREDTERRRRSAPSAADLCTSSMYVCPDSAEPAAGPGAVWLRLGLAEQAANIRLEPADAGFRPPPLGLMPLTLDPAAGITAVTGPVEAVAGLARSFILQLAGYPAARRTRVLIHGSPQHLPLAARFLPRVTLSGRDAATAGHLRSGPGPGCDRGVLIVFDYTGGVTGSTAPPGRAGTSGAAALGALAAGLGWQVIRCAPDAGPHAGQVVVLGGRTARLGPGPEGVAFVADLVPSAVFDGQCRRLASAVGPAAEASEGAGGPLAGILPLGAADIARRWADSGQIAGMPVPVGTGGKGTVHLDLQRDGPHVLVAGTTGSGKSEFLRTLAAALAACYPPDRVNLLFVDFKGGSGLGPLAGLPHCLGMLSDLGVPEVDRTLVSLRAELRRREELLASVKARDLPEYRSLHRGLPALPHLVLIIDEFRMLVDEAPAALTELMRIAAIGRSLGIHLVLATQRPQGSVTADIRANVTSSIALRVQSAMESADIMNSTLAAGIPIGSPGRAFLVRGSEAPEEFQTAVLEPDRSRPGAGPVRVRTAGEWLGAPPPPPDRAGGGAEGRTGAAEGAREPEAAALAGVTGALWEAQGGGRPRSPVAGPLPPVLPGPPPGVPGSPGSVRLGWLDVPEEQRLAELGWCPHEHGHLALVGGAAGGGDAALALAVDQLLAAEQECHLYVLDATGSLSRTAASPRAGAVAGLHEPRRAVRILERLAAEMAARLSTPAAAGTPCLVLAVCGWGSWVSAFRSGPLGRGEDLVQDIVRDGAKAGIAVVVSGDRELASARFFAGIANRIFFPAGSTEESRLGWPRLPARDAVPGRVAVFGPFAPASSTAGHTGQLYAEPGPGQRDRPARGLRKVPFRIEALPRRVSVADVLARPDSPGPAAPKGSVRLCLGVGGDELQPVRLTLAAGSVLAVLGGPGSGKSSLLATLPGLNPRAAGWLRPPAGTDPAQFWAGVLADARSGSLDPRAVLLADDADLQSEECNGHLLRLNSLGSTVILAAGFSPALQHRVPLVQGVRRHGQGVLICPGSILDGDLFGVRFEPEASPPPGRAVVISGGQAVSVQLAADPAAAGSAPGGGP